MKVRLYTDIFKEANNDLILAYSLSSEIHRAQKKINVEIKEVEIP